MGGKSERDGYGGGGRGDRGGGGGGWDDTSYDVTDISPMGDYSGGSKWDQALDWGRKGAKAFGPLGGLAGGFMGWGMHPDTPKTMGDPGGYNARDGGDWQSAIGRGDMLSRFQDWQASGGQGSFRDFIRGGFGAGGGGAINPVTGEPLYPAKIDYSKAVQAGISPPAGAPLYGAGSPFMGPADVFGGM
jgi:hypothetical protein